MKVRMTRESDAGHGPVDFRFTTGYNPTALLETKLMRSTQYWDGLTAQLPDYMKTSGASSGMFVGVAYTKRDVESERYIALPEFGKHVARELKIPIDTERVDARPRLIPPSKMKGTIPPPKRPKT